MKQLFLILSVLMAYLPAQAQYSASSVGATAEQIIDRLQGDSVIILNPEVICRYDDTYGLYEGVGELGIDTGLVLSLSYMSNIFKPYDPSGTATSRVSGLMDDTLLTPLYIDPLMRSWGLPPGAFNKTNYNCALVMNVISLRPNIEFSYVLGDTHIRATDFYGNNVDWVAYSNRKCFLNTNIIGIFISGGAYTDTVNYAVFAQGDDDLRKRKPVNRYTLRLKQEEFDFYCASADVDTMLFDGIPMLDFLRYNTDGALIPDINFCGFSTRMDVSIPVQVCDTHRMVFIVHNTQAWFRNEDGVVIPPIIHRSGTGLFISPLRGTGADTCASTMGIDGTTGDMHIGMYPNPFSDRVLITTPYAQRTYAVQVTDLLGRRYGERLTGTAAQLEVLLAERIQQLSIQQWYLFTITDPATGHSTTFKMRKE